MNTVLAAQLEERLREAIRDVPDFPKPGIIFKDITPILLDPQLSHEVTDAFLEKLEGTRVDAVAAIEARGFIFGFAIAQRLKVPFVLIRKAGKLPASTYSFTYDVEDGSATVEMHRDAFEQGLHILIHDDLLATGGTAAAAASLIQQHHCHVAGFSFLVELEFLDGRKRLEALSPKIDALVKF